MSSETFIKELTHCLDGDRVCVDAESRAIYGKDWTQLYGPNPSVVVFPKTTEEVQACVKICGKYQVPIVASGGRTGLAGGAVATNGELVLSFEKMNKIGEVSSLSRTVRVQAGAITAEVHARCADKGLTWPVDFAASGSSQIGGNISTNAGGIRVIRYGLTRQWVLGLEVVLADGQVLELNGELEKNNTGPDLKNLFIGGEGIFGLITEATLKLVGGPRGIATAVVAIRDLAHGLEVFRCARETQSLTLQAFEYMTQSCVALVSRHRHLPGLLGGRHPAFLLIEVEGQSESDAMASLEGWLMEGLESGLIEDGVVAQSKREAQELWVYREGMGEAMAQEGLLYKFDVSAPIRVLDAFEEEAQALIAEHLPEFKSYFFGHVGDGNLHINLSNTADVSHSEFYERCHGFEGRLYALIQRFSGSVSAEHGIGLLKKKALSYSRTAAELTLMKGIKNVFDPNQLMNPGKIF